jgi:RsiW-degrading membrane proteinase PrsW (M82 family)
MSYANLRDFLFRNIRHLVLISTAVFLAVRGFSSGWLVTVLAIIPIIGWLWFFCVRKQSPNSSMLMNVALCLSAAYLVTPAFVMFGDSIRYLLRDLVGGDMVAWYVLRAGAIEELAKFAGMYYIIRYVAPGAIKHPADSLVLAAAAALGFATYENFNHNLHLVQQTAGTGFVFFLLGALVRVPLHVLYSLMWGAAFGLSRFAPAGWRRTLLLAGGFGGAIFAHGLWDAVVQHADRIPVIIILVFFYAVLWFLYVRLSGSVKDINLMGFAGKTPGVSC